MTRADISLEDFAKKIAEPAMEGGLRTEEYLHFYETDLESEIEVLGLALAEAQALDLYSRAAQHSNEHEWFRKVLLQRLPRKNGVISRDRHQDTR